MSDKTHWERYKEACQGKVYSAEQRQREKEDEPGIKCTYCDQGSSARFVDGTWSHEYHGGWVTCTKNQTTFKKSERLKLFQVLTTIGGKYKTKIEMTLLDTNATEAAATVRRILEDDGFEDVDKILLHIKEIEGPFEAGNVLSRYGG